MVKPPVFWRGTPPSLCQLCGDSVGDSFADASIPRYGQWAMLCLDCFRDEGCKAGSGHGQVYLEQPGGKWLKVEG